MGFKRLFFIRNACFTDGHTIIQIIQGNKERRSGRIKLWRGLWTIIHSVLIIALDALEAAPSALHIVYPAEHICNNGIAPLRWYMIYIQILNDTPVIHSTWRVNLHTIIKNVDVNFTSDLCIVTMD